MGNMLALKERVYLDAERKRVVDVNDPEQAADAAWFLGGPGFAIDEDEANRLGISGDMIGPLQNPLDAVVEQELRNRATHVVSGETMVMPPPLSTATTPERRTYRATTGEPVNHEIFGRTDPEPVTIEAERSASDPIDQETPVLPTSLPGAGITATAPDLNAGVPKSEGLVDETQQHVANQVGTTGQKDAAVSAGKAKTSPPENKAEVGPKETK